MSCADPFGRPPEARHANEPETRPLDEARMLERELRGYSECRVADPAP